MKTIVSMLLMIVAAVIGAFLGAGMNDVMGGAILFAMITGFACTIYAVESGKKQK